MSACTEIDKLCKIKIGFKNIIFFLTLFISCLRGLLSLMLGECEADEKCAPLLIHSFAQFGDKMK